MRHADLRQEAAAGIAAKPELALLLYDTAVCYLVWVCVLWWDERCDGFKNHV